MGGCCPCSNGDVNEEERPLIKEGQPPKSSDLSSGSESDLTGSMNSPPSSRPKHLQPLRMEPLRIEKVDAMFERAVTPYNIIVENYAKVVDTRDQFREVLGLPASASFVQCFRTIQQKLGSNELYIVYEGQFTLLSIEDLETSRDEVRKASKLFRTLIDASKQLLETAPRVSEEMKACSEEARRMLDELGTLAKEAGLNMMQKLAAPKMYASNRTQLVKGPDMIQQFIVKTEDLLKTIQDDAKKFDRERYQ